MQPVAVTGTRIGRILRTVHVLRSRSNRLRRRYRRRSRWVTSSPHLPHSRELRVSWHFRSQFRARSIPARDQCDISFFFLITIPDVSERSLTWGQRISRHDENATRRWFTSTTTNRNASIWLAAVTRPRKMPIGDFSRNSSCGCDDYHSKLTLLLKWLYLGIQDVRLIQRSLWIYATSIAISVKLPLIVLI